MNQNCSLHESFDAKISLKLMYTNHPIWCTAVLGASIERFSRSNRKGLLQYTVDNEVYALARLAFYDNLLIGQEISVSCLH